MRLAAKDYITAGNLLAGLAAAIVGVQGHIFEAMLLLLAAMVFDLLDGVVARITKTQNPFGGSFDNVCDHMSWGIAPCFVLFGAYRVVFAETWGSESLMAEAAAFAVASVPILSASLRFARFNTYNYDVSGIWLGFPRPASAFALVSLVNSSFFSLGIELKLGTILLVVVFGFLNISTHPYPSHHHKGATPWKLWLYYSIFVGGFLLLLVTGSVLETLPRAWAADFTLFCMCSYAFFGWTQVPKEDREAARQAVRDTEAEAK